MHILSSKPSTTATLKRPLLHMLLAAAAMLLAHPAHADLFADNEARRAILDLRQRYQMIDEENAEILANQQKMQKEIDTLRGELSRTRTREEQLARDIAELQRRQKEQDKPLPEERTAPASEANSGSAQQTRRQRPGKSCLRRGTPALSQRKLHRRPNRPTRLLATIPTRQPPRLGTILARQLRLRLAQLPLCHQQLSCRSKPSPRARTRPRSPAITRILPQRTQRHSRRPQRTRANHHQIPPLRSRLSRQRPLGTPALALYKQASHRLAVEMKIRAAKKNAEKAKKLLK